MDRMTSQPRPRSHSAPSAARSASIHCTNTLPGAKAPARGIGTGAVADSIDQGIPIVKLSTRDPVARCLEDMAAALAGAQKETGGWLKTLWGSR